MSELALRLIEENKKTRAPFLDLGNCGLTEVPAEIGDLVWLEGLSFATEWRDRKWKKTQNTGPANTIRHLMPGRFGFNAIKRLMGRVPATNPFSRFQNLKRLWLSGDSDNIFDLTDLSPLAELVNLQTLDVSSTKVADLSPLAGLTSLQALYVGGTQVADLSPLAKLVELQRLGVSNTQVADLSPLAGLMGLQSLGVSNTPVADLSPLAELVGLQKLSIAHTQVIDLSPLAGLAGLRILNAGGIRIANLSPLAELVSLQALDIGGTPVADLSSLAGLVGLITLDVRETPIANLSPLAGLVGLITLDVRETPVADLSPLAGLVCLKRLRVQKTLVTDLSPLLPLIKQGMPVNLIKGVKGIYVKNCTITNPPIEIIQQGNAAILNYLQEKATQGIDHLYEAKLLIVGEGGAGKTSLLRRLYQQEKPLPEEAETTKGIEIHQHGFRLTKENRDFRLNVWDFGGQEIYHATHQFFLTKRSLYVLLDDTRKDYKTVQDEGFKYWLEVVDQLSDHSPIVIFQNEKGGRSKTIDEAGIKGHFPNVQAFYRGNLEQPGAADGLRDALEWFARQLPHIGEELPARWVAIRADIETLARQKPYILQQEYFDLYAQHLPFDRAKALLLSRYFHDLGVFLHFQDDVLLRKTVILQNEWATEAVFKMLDDETVKQALGRFAAHDCQRVWQDSVYADMHAELLVLMQKFELCYRLSDTAPETWLAPQLLPPSKPPELAGWEQAGDLVLRYRYEFLPKGLISRLMVRLHRFVPRPELGWVTGVLFERDGTQVLVEIPPKGGEIALRARGLERKALLSVISADLDALNAGFHGLDEKIDKLVPCNCKQCRTKALPEHFEQKRLLQRKRDGKLKVECPGSYEVVDVLELLDGIRANLPQWANEENPMTTPKKLFISYSKHDKDYKDALLDHLSGLRRRDKIVTWNDEDLQPGEEWDSTIKDQLNQADIVLYLVSARSIATDYIQNIELPLIEERCKRKECKLVPVIVRFCDWQQSEFAKYNALPDKGVPVTDKKHWNDEDEAWLKVVEGIKRLVVG